MYQKQEAAKWKYLARVMWENCIWNSIALEIFYSPLLQYPGEKLTSQNIHLITCLCSLSSGNWKNVIEDLVDHPTQWSRPWRYILTPINLVEGNLLLQELVRLHAPPPTNYLRINLHKIHDFFKFLQLQHMITNLQFHTRPFKLLQLYHMTTYHQLILTWQPENLCKAYK